MSSSTSQPSEGPEKAGDALPSGVPDILVQRIDPAAAPAELQLILANITDDFRRRTGGSDAVADVHVEGTTTGGTQNQPETRLVERPTISKEAAIAKEIKNVSVPNTLPQQLANIFLEVIREGEKVRPKDNQSIVAIMRMYGKAYCPCAEKCCPSVLRTTLDVFPLLYLHQGMVSPEERFPEPSNLESWCTSLFSEKFNALIAGLITQLNEPLRASVAGGITRYEIVQDIIQLENNMIEKFSTFRSAPSVREIKAQRNASIVGLAAAVVTDCPDPLTHPRNLHPLRKALKTLQDAAKTEIEQFMKSCHKVEAELLEGYIKRLEDRLTTDNSDKKATSRIEGEIENAIITKRQIRDLCIAEINKSLGNHSSAIDKVVDDALKDCQDVIDQSSYLQLEKLSRMTVARSLHVARLDLYDDIKKILNGGRASPTHSQPLTDHEVGASTKIQKAMQEVFLTIQNRLGVPIIDRNAFVESATKCYQSLGEKITIQVSENERLLEVTEVLQTLRLYEENIVDSLPEKIDILQARHLCKIMAQRLDASASCVMQMDSRFGVSTQRQAEAFRERTEPLLEQFLPTPSTGFDIEGTGPMLREALIAEFCDAVSRASFLKDERELNVRESRAAIEHDCLETIYTIHDLHQFLLWFGTEMACFRNSHRSELTPSSLDILDDDEIAIHFAPLFRKIGERFDVQNFSLSPASIASIAIVSGTPILAQKALSQIINILKKDNILAKITTLSASIPEAEFHVLQAELNFYMDDIKALLQNFFKAWLKEGIRSFSELNMVKTLIGSSFGEIADKVQRSANAIVIRSAALVLAAMGEQFNHLYASWEKNLQSPANISTEEKDVIDTSPWYANTTLEHSFEEGLDSTLASGKLTDEYLRSSMNVIVENTAGTPQLMSESDISQNTFTEQIEAFRSAALAVVVDLTNPARPVKEKPIQPQTINAPEQYQRLVAGLGYAVDTVSAEPLRRHFAKELLQWFAECEAQRMETNDVVIAYNKALGVLAAENADALEALWKSDEGQASLEAFDVFVAAAERFCASLKDSMTVQEVTLCLRAIREIFTPAVAEILRADATLGVKITGQHEAALQKIEAQFNPPPTE